MGARQSSQNRTVSMDNSNGVINISDAVVQRLRSGMIKAEGAKQIEQAKQQPQEEKQNVPSSYLTATRYPPGVLSAEPTISALEVRRQKELELQQNDLYWRKRLAQLEQTFNKTNSIMEKEYSDAVEDVRRRFQSAPPEHQLPPCQTLKAQLIACYRVNPGETLKCSEEATAFINCVTEHRFKRLDAAEDSSKQKAAKAERTK